MRSQREGRCTRRSESKQMRVWLNLNPKIRYLKCNGVQGFRHKSRHAKHGKWQGEKSGEK